MWISQYFVLFAIYSCLGWVFESLYCSIEHKKWDNRGFLYGPFCPIYGVGGVAVTAITDAIAGPGIGFSYAWYHVFLVSFFGSVVLEYFTSWVLEKLFHAYWWDYSRQPLNINGRVCFFCSLGFGFGGLLVVYGLTPLVRKCTAWISPVGYEILALFIMALLAADITMTVSTLTHFEKAVELLGQNVNRHLEQFVETVVEKTRMPERERFTQESIEQFLHSLGAVPKEILRKIQGFRKSKRTDAGYLDTVLAQLKERIGKKK